MVSHGVAHGSFLGVPRGVVRGPLWTGTCFCPRNTTWHNLELVSMGGPWLNIDGATACTMICSMAGIVGLNKF